MPILPVNNNIDPLYSWSIVLQSGTDSRLIKVFTRLKTKVCSRLLNGYKRLKEDVIIDNQGDVEFFSIAPIGELRI